MSLREIAKEYGPTLLILFATAIVFACLGLL